MTDAQLSLLLYQYAMRLSALLDAAESELPDEVKNERRWLNPMKPPDYQTVVKLSPALDELRDFAQELKQDSELLELSSREAEKPKNRV